MLLGARFQAHPGVLAVNVVPAARSMTVSFDPAYSFEEIARTLPVVARTPPVDRAGLDWSRVITAGLLALLPLGPWGSVAVSVAGCVAEQLREGLRSPAAAVNVRRAPGPVPRLAKP